jgi:glycosyl transferase family 25
MNIFVISLESSLSRQEHIKNEFLKEKIPFSFFKAVTPDKINSVSEKIGVDVSNREITNGEVACFLSHVSLWKKMIDNNLDYICIFEDDINLGTNVSKFLLDMSCYPEDFDIIKLESFDKEVFIDKNFNRKVLDRNVFKLVSRNLGGAGYILSRKCSQKLINFLKNCENIEAVDNFLFETILNSKKFNIYHVEPSICKQDFLINGSYKKFSSSLELERRKRLDKNKVRLSLPKKIIREILRIFRQIYKFFQIKIFEKNSLRILSTFK